MALELESFYMIISPEQDSQGKILINRKSGQLRNWYFCSQEFDNSDDFDKKILEIANDARIVALSEAYIECDYKGEFKLARPKSCNEKAAKKYVSGKIVIILDNFNLEEKICDIHNGYLCRSIDDDPRIWKKSKWGRKYTRKKRKIQPKGTMGTLADKMPKELKKASK
jgi:hypothetical protein